MPVTGSQCPSSSSAQITGSHLFNWGVIRTCIFSVIGWHDAICLSIRRLFNDIKIRERKEIVITMDSNNHWLSRCPYFRFTTSFLTAETQQCNWIVFCYFLCVFANLNFWRSILTKNNAWRYLSFSKPICLTRAIIPTLTESDSVRMNIWLSDGLPNLQTIHTVLILTGSTCSTPLSVN